LDGDGGNVVWRLIASRGSEYLPASIDFDKKTGKPADNTIQFGSEIPVDVVPPEFNKQSTIEFEVVAGKNNVFNYDIKTDFVTEMPKNAKTKDAIPT